MDFSGCDVEQWRKALSDYALHINSKLAELDKFYTQALPPILQARNPTSYITKEELKKIMEWKLSRGKWRPRLLSFVSAADEEEVKKASQKAFAALPDLKEAVTAMCVVKGVGPATASAVLAAYAPQIAPFMSDEAMLAAHGSSNDYSLKRYLAFAEKLQNKAKELNIKAGFAMEGDNGSFTPSDIERALWSAAMGVKEKHRMSAECI
ncbi:hypothetical protein SUGI_0054510 [Cryptomeria japonica]|nr:hypothetical protein SUGI_0054510 [Cryptomeria japonica]